MVYIDVDDYLHVVVYIDVDVDDTLMCDMCYRRGSTFWLKTYFDMTMLLNPVWSKYGQNMSRS